ncbi:type II secretion system F family protein [Aquipseudomonas campi]
MNIPLLIICTCMAGAAIWLWRRGIQQAHSQQVLARLGYGDAVDVKAPVAVGLIERAFIRAGMEMEPGRLRLMLTGWLLLLAIGWLRGGWLFALLALAVPPLLLRMWLAWRVRRRTKRMIEQLPALLDQVLRSLHSGKTLGDAMVRAIDEAPEPLSGALQRVSNQVRLGVGLAEALEEAADLYAIEELRILTLGVRVNHRYGGSAGELLQNLINVIHERDNIARQFRAMTGETRITAWVLGCLPLALAGYILVVNPNYLMSMWLDPSGRTMLLASFGMQAFGCFLLWRMLRNL